MIVKGLGILSLGSMCVGGVSLTHPELFKIKRVSPPDLILECHSLSEDINFNTEYSKGNKFGKKHKNFLVGVTNKKVNDSQYDIAKWWDWAFKRLSVAKPDKGKFKDVTSGYGTESHHLSQVCKEAYGTEESGFDEQDENKFKKAEVWEYCSIGGTLPQTIKEFNGDDPVPTKEEYGDSSTIGAYRGSNAYPKLLSIKSDDNEWIWDIKNQEFFSSSNIITNDSYFKSERDKDVDKRQTIKKICERAYPNTENMFARGAKKFTAEETVKYCSLIL